MLDKDIADTRLAVLFGTDAQSGKVGTGQPFTAAIGTTDVRLLGSGDTNDFIRLNIPRNFHRQKARPSFAQAGTVFNMITDPELNPIVLEHARRFLKPFKGRILNRPEAVQACTRDGVAKRLAGIEGLIVPRVVRFPGRPKLALVAIEKAGLPMPAILRRTGHHDGRIEGLFEGRDRMLARLHPAHEYFLTEFIDSRSPDAFYHKIRIFFLGGQGVIRHRLLSDRWNVHAPDRLRILVDQPQAIEEERRLVEGGIEALPPAARRALAEIRARMPLDFFGIDFAIMPDGRVLLFEANATMMFFPVSDDPRFAYGATALARGRAAFAAMMAGG